MGTPVQQLFDLRGQTALVTGGSRGLGLQIAEAQRGAGADAAHVEIVEIIELPMTHMRGGAPQIKVRAVGPVAALA